MERLTKICNDGGYTRNCDNCWKKGDCYDSADCVDVMIDRLAEYEDIGFSPKEIRYCIPDAKTVEDARERAIHAREIKEEWIAYREAEERGELVHLPCKVGDTVYRVWFTEGRKPEIATHKMERLIDIVQWLDKFGKTVFITREEAEATLAEREAADAADRD